MILLPIENFTINTTLTKDEVITKLNEVVEPYKIRSLSIFTRSDMPYAGNVNESSFKIWRVRTFRNSFQPIIKGEVSQTNSSTEIKLMVRPDNYMVLFILIAFIIIPISGMFLIGTKEYQYYFRIIFILLFYAMIVGEVKYESKKIKEQLTEILSNSTH